jgi:hypothetical protein
MSPVAAMDMGVLGTRDSRHEPTAQGNHALRTALCDPSLGFPLYACHREPDIHRYLMVAAMVRGTPSSNERGTWDMVDDLADAYWLARHAIAGLW